MLKRPQRYCLHNFKEEVVQSLAELEEYGIPNIDQWKPPSTEPSAYETVHIPTFSCLTKHISSFCYKLTVL